MKAAIITGFSPKRSTRNPAGIDITPYAIKKENGNKAAAARLTLKLVMMSGTIGPRMLVSSDITKNVRKTMLTMYRFRGIDCDIFCAIPW